MIIMIPFQWSNNPYDDSNGSIIGSWGVYSTHGTRYSDKPNTHQNSQQTINLKQQLGQPRKIQVKTLGMKNTSMKAKIYAAAAAAHPAPDHVMDVAERHKAMKRRQNHRGFEGPANPRIDKNKPNKFPVPPMTPGGLWYNKTHYISDHLD